MVQGKTIKIPGSAPAKLRTNPLCLDWHLSSGNRLKSSRKRYSLFIKPRVNVTPHKRERKLQEGENQGSTPTGANAVGVYKKPP